MAEANKISVQFEARGGKELQDVIDRLHLSTIRLTKSQKAYDRALIKLNTSNKKIMDGLLGLQHSARQTTGTFSILRSKLFK